MATARPPDENIAWKVWVGSIVGVVLSTVAVIARIVARRLSAAEFWWDDFFIVFALVMQWGMGIVRWIMLVNYSYGRHIQYVGKANVISFWKSFMAVQLIYFSNAVFTKMSLLFLYQRIFGLIRPFRIALMASGFCVIGYWIACTILAFAGCHPLEKNWDKTVPGGCVDLIAFFRWNGICNLLIDFLILCLPMPMVWRLKITVKQKLVLSSIFALGLFTCVTSILRVLAYNPNQVKDATYSTVGTVTWSSVEQGLGIVCACLPTLRPLFGFLYPSQTKSRDTNSTSIGMDAYTGKSPHVTSVKHSGWGDDSGSTVGFARLQDEEGIMSPIEMQRSVYGAAPIGNTATTSTGGGQKTTIPFGTGGILKESTIDQRSEIIRRGTSQ